MAVHDRRAVGARVVVPQTTRLLPPSRLGALSRRMGAELPQRASRWVRSHPAALFLLDPRTFQCSTPFWREGEQRG
jgi:hypothetical protein